VHAALGALSLGDVRVIASIESKAGEAALLDFCTRHALPLRLFTGAQIAGVETSASPHVQKHLDLGGVCEPCALLASHDGHLVVTKTIVDGVTVAIAADRITLNTSKSHA
jgi:cobalt-precorrin 5A hydrolase